MLIAKSIASDLNDILTSKTVDGIIHSVFDRACNIQLDRNSLITLISSTLPHYPNSIKIDIPENLKICSVGFKIGMKVEVNNDEIKIPDIPISILLTGAWVWDSAPLFLKLTISEETLFKNIEKVRELTLKYGKMEGIASILNGDEIANKYKDFIINSVKQLANGISYFDYRAITEASNRLIGFGPGLTPAADDFLLGIMAAIYYIGNYYSNKFENLQKITKAMISFLPGRTTLVSEMMLKNGMMARFPEPIRDLMLAVTNNTNVQDKCINLLNIGGTSGSDCAAGIVFGGPLMIKAKRLK